MDTSDTLVIKHASQLVTISALDTFSDSPKEALGILDDGALILTDGKITWIGTTAELPDSAASYPALDATGTVVMPGFIDCHTNLAFAGTREHEFEQRLRGATYLDIAREGGGINTTVRATRQASQQELSGLMRTRLDTMLRFGTTTVAVNSGYGLSTEHELKLLRTIWEFHKAHPVDVIPVFLGAHDVPTEYKDRREDYVQLVISEMIPHVAEEGLSQFCSVFCDRDMFSLDETRRILEAGMRHGLKPRMHADLFSPFKAAELAADIGTVSAAHLLLVSDQGIKRLAEKDIIAELIPGFPFFLALVKYAPARRMLEAGVKIALATGFSPGGCMTESLPLIMTMACTQMSMTPAETIIAVTAQAAKALQRFDEIGSLEVGKQADLVLFDIPDYQYLTYHFGVNHVKQVIKRGKIVVDRGK